MTTNLLPNPSFEGGHTDLLPYGGRLTNQVPMSYNLFIRQPGTRLLSADSYDGPDDPPVYDTVTVVPECVHKTRDQLPDADELILEGDTVFKIFSGAGAFSVDLSTQVLITQDGYARPLTNVRVHHHGDGSPGAAVWRLVFAGYTGPWHAFGNGFEDREYVADWAPFQGYRPGGVMTATLQVESRSLAGIDFFTDAWAFEFTPDEQPQPPATECPQPREGWTERTTVLVRADAPDDIWLAACAWANDPTRRHSVDKSWDHAMWGPGLESVNVILWMDNPDAFDENVIDWWALEHYGDINLTITEHIAYDAPQPPEEPQYWLRSDNLIGLHSGFTRAMSQPYILESGTCIQKFFSAGDAYHAAKDAPGIVSVWRKYVGNEQGRIWEQPTIRLSALWYLDQYTAEIETARTNMGLTLEQFLEREISIESLNETIPTYNQPVLEDAVAFDVHFCDLAHERYGEALSTVLLCGAIGNPHESEVPLLLPAAEIAARWKDYIGYHPYWTDNEHDNDPRFINQHWPYHAGRWMEWDTYFRSQGVYPRYAGGEGGTVYAWDGVSFDSGKGWKACGSMEKYLDSIAIYNQRVLDWNKIHGNRCAGLTLFGYGNWGWDNFELGDGDVQLLLNWATGTPASYSEMLAFALEQSKEASSELYLASATYISDDWRKQIESREPIKRGIW